MGEIACVGKNGRNKEQGYSFRSIDDFYDAVQPAMVKHKVFITPTILVHERETRTTKSGSTLMTTLTKVRFKLWTEDGSFVEADALGEGADSGDKSANKSAACAIKYLFMQVFAVRVHGENYDTENETHNYTAPPRALPPPPRVPTAQPAATPAPTLAGVLAASKAKLLAQPAPVRGAMLRHFVEAGQLTDTDTLEALDVETLFPSVIASEGIAANRPRVKADAEALMAAVQASMDDGQIEGAEIATDGQGQGSPVSAPEPPPGLPPGVQSKRITPIAKAVKPGVSKTGKPWTRHGIHTDSEEWFNTFNKSIADQCEVGRTVTAWFTSTNYGNDLHAVTQ